MFILAFLRFAAGTFFVSFDSMLDPEEIFWPNYWVASMVTLSSNHQEATDAKAMVKFNVPMDLPVGTYAELNLGFANPFSVVLDKAQAKENDNEIIFTVGTLPSKGVYGPISLKIRQGSTGQILAASNNIGILALLDPIKSSNSLVIAHTDGSNAASQSTSLKFSFTLLSSLNPFDVIFLEFDSSFSIGKTSSLEWDQDASGTAYLKTMNYQFIDSDNVVNGIYIYGCLVEVPASSVVAFIIKYFNNPDHVKAANSYLWTLSIIRFGTETTLQKYSGTSPSVEITAGPISIVKWEAANKYIDVTTQLAQDSILFMVLTFSISRQLSEEGTLVISFTGLTLNDISYKPNDATQALKTGSPVDNPYIYTDSEKISCQITSSTEVACTVQKSMALASNSQINVYTLAHFSSSASSASVSNIVSSKSSIVYDKLSTSKTLTLQTSTAKLITETEAYFATLSADISDTAVNSAASSPSAGLCISFKTKISLVGPIITVRAPIIAMSDSTADDATFTTVYQGIYKTIVLSDSPIDYSVSGSLATPADNMILFEANRKIKITHPKSFSAEDYVDVVITAGSTANSASTIKMPYFSTGLKSMHEFTISFTSDNVFYYYSKPFYYAPVTASAIFTLACTSAGLSGALAQILWTGYSNSVAYTVISGYSVYADFMFTSDDSTLKGDYGSGLDSGSKYPSNDVGTGNTFTIKYSEDESNSHSTHLILDYISSIPSGPTDIRFPFPSLVSGKIYTLKARIYAKTTLDENLYLLSESVTPSITATAAISTIISSSISDSSLSQNMLETISSFTFTINTLASTGGAGLVFSKGFYLSDTSTFYTNSLTIYSSEDSSCNFYTAFIGSKTLNVASDIPLTLTNVLLPWYTGSASFIFYAVDSSEFSNNACTHSATITLNLVYTNSNNLIIKKYSPTSAIGFGYSSQVVDLEINFQLPKKIRALSEISFQVSIGDKFNAIGCIWQIKVENYYVARGIVQGSSFNSLIDVDTIDATAPGQVTEEIPIDSILIIKIYDVVVPKVIDSTSAIYPGFSSVSVMYNNNYVYKFIDSTDGSDSTTRTTFNVGASAVKSNISSVYAFPNTQEAKDVFLEIVFTTTIDLPKGTDITIQGEAFLSDSSANDNTWCSEGFSSAIVSGSNLILTTIHEIYKNTEITIRKDKAFNIGSESTKSPAFMIKALYMDINFIEDENSYTDTNAILYASKPLGTVKSASLDVEITSIGMLSTHIFTLTLSLDTIENWYFVFVAPKSYNAHPGPYFEYEVYSDVHYYTAFYNDNTLYCYGEHWIITCSGIGVVYAKTPINIYILLNNPGSLSVNWKFYILDSNDNHVIFPYEPISFDFTELPESIFDIQYVHHNQTLVDESNVQIRAKVTDKLSSNDMIAFIFPQSFQLEFYNSKTISCSYVYEKSPPVDVFPEDSICNASLDTVSFVLQEPVELSSDYWNLFTFYNIKDPATGLNREDDYFDAFDTEIFDVYKYWTRKFTALILASSEGYQTVTSISFANLNSAYTGFYSSDMSYLMINGGENVFLIPGSYSGPISISTSDSVLHASWLEIYPSNTEDYSSFLTFSGSADYYLTNDSPQTTFRIGIYPGSSNFLIYLSWEIYESSFIDNYYKPPTKTLINIFPDIKIQIQVSEISYAVPGYSTFPIELSIAPYFPISELNIEFNLLSPDSKVEFIPKIVTFTTKDSAKSFQIAVDNTIPIGTVYNFNYTLSGEYSECFDIVDFGEFTVGNINTEAPIIKTAIDVKNNVKADLLVNLNSDSIVYWALISSFMYEKYPEMATLDYIKNYSAPAVGECEDGQSFIEDQIAAWGFAISQVPGDTWEEYNNNFLKLGSQTYFASIKYFKKGDSVLQSFTNLIASTNLVLVAWADNMSGHDLANSKSLERTEDPLPPAILEISFDETLTSSSIDLVPQSLSLALEVYSSMVTIWLKQQRRLESTVVSCLLLPSVYFYINPLEKALKLTVESLAKSLAINGVTSTFSFSGIESAESIMFGNPGFYHATFIKKLNVLEFWFSSEIYETTICIEELNPDLSIFLSSYNILFGLDRNGNSALTTFYSTNYNGDYEVIEWNLDEISTEGNYVFSCTICNNYPITPECLSENEIESYNFTWATVSYGVILRAAFIIWLSF